MIPFLRRRFLSLVLRVISVLRLVNNLSREKYNACLEALKNCLESLKCQFVGRCTATSFSTWRIKCTNFCVDQASAYCEPHLAKYRDDCRDYHLFTNYREWYYVPGERQRINNEYKNFDARVAAIFRNAVLTDASIQVRLAYLAVVENDLRRKFSAEFLGKQTDKGHADFSKTLWEEYNFYFKINTRGEIVDQDNDHLTDQDFFPPYSYYKVQPLRFDQCEDEDVEKEQDVAESPICRRRESVESDWDE